MSYIFRKPELPLPIHSYVRCATGLLTTLFAISMLAFVGCDPDYVPQNRLAQVSGEVTLDGRVVEGAKVVFVPLDYDSNDLAPYASGTTNGKGEFELKLNDGKPGARTGKYLVVISKSQPAKPSASELGLYRYDPIRRSSSSKVRESKRMSQGQMILQMACPEIALKPSRRLSRAIAISTPDVARLLAPQSKNELIPSHYNRDSILVREVRSTGGTDRPKFELKTIDPLLIEAAE